MLFVVVLFGFFIGFLGVIPSVDADESTVEMVESQFVPKDIYVKPGDTLIWVNKDSYNHDVTFENGVSSGPSGGMAPDTRWSFTFNQTGTYRYRCVVHSPDFENGMVGRVIVSNTTSSDGGMYVMGYRLILLFHILTVVFMSIPLYNLVVVNERAKMGKTRIEVDRYFENIIRSGSIRCYAFQATAIITGVAMILWRGMSIVEFITNIPLVTKTIILFTLMSLLSIVHFRLQPRIDRLLSEVSADAVPPGVLSQLLPVRLLRKRLAAICLFLVILAVILGVQVFAQMPLWLNSLLMILGALFSFRVYRTGVGYGWI